MTFEKGPALLQQEFVKIADALAHLGAQRRGRDHDIMACSP